MRELDDVLRPRTERNPNRERALSAFFDLGEKLRNFYARGKQDGEATDKSHIAGAVTLSDTIEGEIIPRLMLAHEALECDADSALDDASIVSADDSELFLQAILNDSATAAHQQIDALMARGVSRDAICLELMATTARRLGDMWDNDLCDFTQVTIGLCRLHEILRNNSALSIDADATVRHGGVGAPRVLLSTACGDQHVFGVVMVAEFFREAGWAVSSEPGAARKELCDIVRAEHYDVVGLSAACDACLDEIEDEIAALRDAACNPDLKILVGGRVFTESPDLASTIGADAAANDAKAAPAVGRKLLAVSRLSC